jgi:hypothetical protein
MPKQSNRFAAREGHTTFMHNAPLAAIAGSLPKFTAQQRF